MSSHRRMDLHGLESLCASLQNFYEKNGQNPQSRDLTSYGYSTWLIILCHVDVATRGSFFSITVVPSCLNHPPQKEYCLLSCHASFGAVSSYSDVICLKHRRKSTPIRLSSTDSQRHPSCCSCTHATKSSRFCRVHGSSSTAYSRRASSSTGSWPS